MASTKIVERYLVCSRLLEMAFQFVYDGLGDAQGAAGGLHVEVLHHPAVVGDDAGAGAGLPGLEDAAGVLHRLHRRREGGQ